MDDYNQQSILCIKLFDNTLKVKNKSISRCKIRQVIKVSWCILGPGRKLFGKGGEPDFRNGQGFIVYAKQVFICCFNDFLFPSVTCFGGFGGPKVIKNCQLYKANI
eukprot:TRINITY_DN2913_c2_g1_i6.p6 TRINITY_DN2913_c2_g1~~TRINITY_DN2913_c2_g1_i6.p6  ORF type:complete len:106 (+),score=3.95 TRINITY_DN2913_c2_g1_i6:954-1271(+)